ncbi:MAG: hypothetical protein IJS32_08250 [Kiritimatiellae bacterium]|nr:hypothetical protein [Kiritimatiellia bacterium]
MTKMLSAGLMVFACAAVAAGTEGGTRWYACKYCGHKAVDARSLTGSACLRHPAGPGKGRNGPALQRRMEVKPPKNR